MPTRDQYAPGTPSWVDLSSPDIDASVEFYGALFGWEATEPGPVEETGGYRMFEHDGVEVAGIGPVQEGGVPAWNTYVTVDDVDATAKEVTSAGGAVYLEPMQVMDAGRMAVFADDQGAVFSVWEAGEHIGAGKVNEPVALCWNELRTRDLDKASAFYGRVFGWEGVPMPEMDGYLIASLGGDDGIAGMMDMASGDMPDEVPPHWDAGFAVDDTDGTIAKLQEMGGQLIAGPFDIAPGRYAQLQDPHGAMFSVITLAGPTQ